MPRAERGSAKDVSNRMKAKGLGRLRWYCQVCEKQMRDENGFKCHTMTEAHHRQMLLVSENAGKTINEYSGTFKAEFIRLLSRRWGTKRVYANQVYQEYISDKNHAHMNATQWVTLTEFVKHLGREGICHVDETERGWFIAWIDNSPRTLSKQASSQKRERVEIDDEQREQRHIAQQIEKARQEKEANEALQESSTSSSSTPVPEAPSGPIKLSIGLKKPQENISSSSISNNESNNKNTATPNPIKINPLKQASKASAKNALKSSSLPTSNTPSTSLKRDRPMSAVESILIEEKERKRRREEAIEKQTSEQFPNNIPGGLQKVQRV